MVEKYILSQAIDTTSNVTRLADRPGGIYRPDQVNQFPLVSAGEDPIALGDFNGDGSLDLLTGGSYYINYGFTRRYEGITTLYLGDAEGKFGNPQSYHVDSPDQYVGDFNKDGNLDVLIVGQFYLYTQKATLLPGDGKGGFGNPVDSRIALENSNPQFSTPLRVEDYNQDGNIDIVFESFYYDPPELRVAFGDGTGKFGLIEAQSDVIAHSVPSSQPKPVSGDINKDGKLDVVTTYLVPGDTPRTDINVFLNTGDETPSLQTTQPPIDPLTGVKANDKIVGSQVEASLQTANQRDNFIIGEGKPFVPQRNRIGDFMSGQDTLVLNSPTFALGEDLSFARAKSLGKAKRSSADLVYVRGTGKLFYNENQQEKGFGKGGLIVDLADGLNLRKSDILVSLG